MLYFYYHTISPIALQLGPIVFYWYGIMYGIGFCFAMWFLSYYSKRYFDNDFIWTTQNTEYLLCVCIFGILIGGRVGYVIFYQWHFFTKNLLWIFNIWEGGMSFHGGLIGTIIAIFYFSYKKRYNFFQISDFVTPVVPFGLGLGRIGNFINGELWGRVIVNSPIAVLFPKSEYQDILVYQDYPQWYMFFSYYKVLPRHPSQLYEMILEGIILFIIINIFICKKRPVGSTSALFLLFYGIFRIIIEFFRQPDSQIGFIYGVITMGQILSIPMVIFGIIIVYFAYRNNLFLKI